MNVQNGRCIYCGQPNQSTSGHCPCRDQKITEYLIPYTAAPHLFTLTRDETLRALKTMDGIFLFSAIHGWNTPDPDVIKLFDWLRATYNIKKSEINPNSKD